MEDGVKRGMDLARFREGIPISFLFHHRLEEKSNKDAFDWCFLSHGCIMTRYMIQENELAFYDLQVVV